MVARHWLHASTLSFLMLGSSVAFALDQACATLASSVEVGSSRLYYNLRAQEWVPLDGPNASMRVGTKAEFVYVIREDRPIERGGVLVVKTSYLSGRGALRTLLKRDPQRELSNDPCGDVEDFKFNNSSVSSPSYDLYHDVAGAVGDRDDLQKINSFHITKYVGRKKSCKSTNSVVADSLFDRRSNRSQFSFDSNVVENGLRSQLAKFFGLGPAQAATNVQRRVEMRRYRMGDERIACVHFALSIDGPEYLLRLNDLESHVRGEITRGKEQTWSLN